MSDPRNRPQNVKPKISNSSTSHHYIKDDQRHKDKPHKPRRSRSIDSSDRGRRRERPQPGDRRPRGRSEEARRGNRKDRDTNNTNKKYTPEDDIDDTECAICFCSYDNIFKTPKLLSCGHTFCLECLARINVTSTEIKSLPCPVCREITEIPHGQDLPRLGNNQDIIGKLPQHMQHILSIRFKRSKGKLVLKKQHQNPTGPTKAFTLPMKKSEIQVSPTTDGNVMDLEQGIQEQTEVDVGRPPSRVRGRLRRLFRSDRCYYAVVVSIITITVVLMLIGIFAFVIIPNVMVHRRPGNHTDFGELDSEEHHP